MKSQLPPTSANFSHKRLNTVPLVQSVISNPRSGNSTFACRAIAFLSMQMASASIPHPKKEHYGGEDAFFISSNSCGVADGVGGWQDSGINPADYSTFFMTTSQQYFEGTLDDIPTSTNSEDYTDTISTTTTTTTALGALSIAHQRTMKPGSATACVIRLDRATSSIDAANLGDSGFLIIRNGDIVFKSEHQQHFFDCPYQFGASPEASDSVDDADVYKVPVQANDVIILATDGVFDNVWPEEIVELAPKDVDSVEDAALAIACRASEHANDPDFESPYSKEAEAELQPSFWDKLANASFENGKLELGKRRGGKLDDITVIVGFVVEENNTSHNESSPQELLADY